MGKKSGPRSGTKNGKQGKGRSISKVKKTNIRHTKLAKKGKMKPPGSKPLFLEGGHMHEKKIASAAKRKTLNRIEMEQEAERKREYETEKKQMEEEAYDQMVDMMDPEDIDFLKKQASSSNPSYELLQNSVNNGKKRGFSKTSLKDNAHILDDYEKKAIQRQSAEQDFKRAEEELEGKKRPLLPIRTKEGWQPRSGKAINNNSSDELEMETNGYHETGSESEGVSSGDETVNTNSKINKTFSVIDIVAKRRLIIQKAKLQIGSMASNFIEAPEERVQVLEKLVKLVSDDISEVKHIFKTDGEDFDDENFEGCMDLLPAMNTVSKLAALSVCEILKDIIPNYKIIDTSLGQSKETKLKKDTLKLQRYENAILICTKNYLIKLERIVANRGKNEKKRTNSSKKSVLLNNQKYAIQCTSELLKTHPYFNYMSDNVVNFLVPFLNSSDVELRTIVGDCIKHVFVNDKRGEVAYAIVKKINHHLKTKTHEKIQPDMLDVLLSIPLYSLNEANAQRENDLDNKKSKKGKNEPYVSKKERKRLKATDKLEKELLEAKGQESSKTKLRFATDITNVLFAIYFRLLKTITDPTFLAKKGSKRTFKILLNPLLSGLSKFGHLMSIEFFQDLLRTLTSLLVANTVSDNDDHQDKPTEEIAFFKKPLLGGYEILKCVEAVFSILSGQGDQLTIDPSTFYAHLSRTISELNLIDGNDEFLRCNNSTSTNRDIYSLACAVLRLAYVRRRKKVTRTSVTDAWKRVGISALQSHGIGASKLLEFLRECGNTCPTLWSNYLNVDGDDEVGGECAAAGIIGPAMCNGLGAHKGIPTADEKFVSNVNRYHLWELSLLQTHVESRVVSAIETLFKSSVSTTINASSNDTSFNNHVKKPTFELSIPPNITAISNINEEMLIDGDEEFVILSKNLAPMRNIASTRRKRKAKPNSNK